MKHEIELSCDTIIKKYHLYDGLCLEEIREWLEQFTGVTSVDMGRNTITFINFRQKNGNKL
jgi:hypothetical protein